MKHIKKIEYIKIKELLQMKQDHIFICMCKKPKKKRKNYHTENIKNLHEFLL